MQNITTAGIKRTEESRKTNEKPQEQINNNNNNNGFDTKNYLNDRLNEGEKKKELIIRLLPIDKDSDTPFKIIKMHKLKVPTELAKSGFKNYVCLEETEDIDHDKYGKKCPICELRHEAFKRSKDQTLDQVERDKWYQIGKENFTNEVCIIRCIERGHEEDGPKFWKFTVRKDGTDPYNMINELVKARSDEKIAYGFTEEEAGNILDVYNGKDLKIIITEEKKDDNSKSGNNTKKGIKVLDFGPEGPVSRDASLMEQWINDKKKWSDVFTVKPYDYLSIVLEGKVPFFDKNEKKWVEKENKSETNESVTEEETEKASEINNKIEESVPSSIDNSDLPF